MIEKTEDGTIHLAGDSIDTLLLALCCLQVLWKDYPDMVRVICKETGTPDLTNHGAEARRLIHMLTGLKS